MDRDIVLLEGYQAEHGQQHGNTAQPAPAQNLAGLAVKVHRDLSRLRSFLELEEAILPEAVAAQSLMFGLNSGQMFYKAHDKIWVAEQLLFKRT